jgi:cytochrome c peroxidase
MKISRIATAFCVSNFLLSAIVSAGTIDLLNLFNYENQPKPNYITRDNTGTNPIDDAAATLGRVLFYDKALSVNNTVSCATCHQQQFAFTDPAVVSQGVNGVTGRHSMRLINSRFGNEVRFFWDERATTLEEQVTQPIKDHVEMGFSGTNGNPSFQDLINKMGATPYYKTLFTMAFGDATITEDRMKLAMAQFVRSIQSFDSKFDVGLAAVNGNLNAPFPNFTAQENQGKNLYLAPPQFQAGAPGRPPTGNRVGGGLGCQTCHQAPEFSIDRQGNGPQRNNGVITVANNPSAVDLTNSRSSTLRDMFSSTGMLHGPLMHDGSFGTIDELLNHYNDIPLNPTVNTLLDPRLTGVPPQSPPGPGQNLLMTPTERAAVTAFLKTLTGTSVYSDERWSDPFGPEGELDIIGNVQLARVVVGDGTIQRTSIKTVTFRFAGAVVVKPGAFSVMQRSSPFAPTFVPVASTTSTAVYTATQTIVTVRFRNYVRNTARALIDGNYQITLAGHLLLRDGIPMGSDIVFGDEQADGFYSFFGDTDGNRFVDDVDLAKFNATFGKSIGQPDYNALLDYDNNGVVNSVDQSQFQFRYGRSIPFHF